MNDNQLLTFSKTITHNMNIPELNLNKHIFAACNTQTSLLSQHRKNTMTSSVAFFSQDNMKLCNQQYHGKQATPSSCMFQVMVEGLPKNYHVQNCSQKCCGHLKQNCRIFRREFTEKLQSCPLYKLFKYKSISVSSPNCCTYNSKNIVRKAAKY